MLNPNNKQETKLFQMSGASRFAYNWALARQQENYSNGGKFLQDGVLRKEFTQLKKLDEYSWLNCISCNVTKQAIKDACLAYKRFFKGQSKFPRFKSKRKTRPSFYQDNVKIQFTNIHVKLEKIASSTRKNRKQLNYIRLSEKGRIPYDDVKYMNPRVTYNGLNWFISVGIDDGIDIDTTNYSNDNSNNGIGIDLGIKDLAICSDGVTYKNINKSKKIRQVKKQLKHKQKRVAKKYDKLKSGKTFKKNKRITKTNNITKLEREILKKYKQLANIRQDYLHKTTSQIVNRKPKFITIEDLSISNMMKNKHLSKAIQEQCLYDFVVKLQYKCKWSNIELRQVNRWYPSSKLCSSCGNKKKELKLSDRVYICEECGSIIDRDFNASLNLAKALEYKVISNIR